MRLPHSFRALVLAAIALHRRHVNATGTDCSDGSACLGGYDPLCGSDDTTYFNQCNFDAAQCQTPSLALVARGVCCPVACPQVLAPVCGSDGETYRTACDLLRARCDGAKMTLKLAAQGPCGTDCASIRCEDQPENPLCGSDYRTYKNECELKHAQCLSGDAEEPSFVSDGPCDGGPFGPGGGGPNELAEFGMPLPLFMPSDLNGVEEPPADLLKQTSGCPGTAFQICGSDATSYGDVCQFVAARRVNPGIQFASLGPCSTAVDVTEPQTQQKQAAPVAVDQCSFECPAPDRYEPVCTPDGTVFPTTCAFVQAFCADMTLPAASADNCDPLVLPPCPPLASASVETATEELRDI